MKRARMFLRMVGAAWVFLSVSTVFVGQDSYITKEMTWGYGEPVAELPSAKHVMLTFVEYPEVFVGMYSDDLGGYLESLPTKKVKVRFKISYVFGGREPYDWLNPVQAVTIVKSYLLDQEWSRIESIGERTRWQMYFSYMGSRGNGGRGIRK